MAVVSVTEIPVGRGGGFQAGYTRRYKRIFRVVTNDERDGPIVVAFASGIPRLYSSYVSFGAGESDPLAICTDVDPQQADSNPLIWIVTLSYEKGTGQQAATGGSRPTEGGAADDPALQPPKKRWSYGVMQWPFRRALDNLNTYAGPRVTNSAGYPFAGVMTNIRYSILTYERYEATFNTTRHRLYADSVNEAAWNGYDVKLVHLADWQAEEEFYGSSLSYFKHIYTFHFCPLILPNWQMQLLDAGKGQIVAGKKVPILDDLSKQPVSMDWPLNGSGVAYTPAEVAAGSASYLTFKDHPTRPFDVLSITL